MTKYSRIEELPLYPRIRSGEFSREWVEVGLTEGPRVSYGDVERFFEYLELPLDEVVWCSTMVTAGRACRLKRGGVSFKEWDRQDVPDDWIEEKLGGGEYPPVKYEDSFWCQLNADWMADALALEGTGIDLTAAKMYEPLVRGAGWSFYYDGTCFLSPREGPVLNDVGFLHNAEGPVMCGTVYALHGRVLPSNYEWVVRDRETLTQELIDGITNAEIRRLVILTYPEKYLKGPPVQEDSYGKLYKVEDEEEPEMSYGVVRVEDAMSDRVFWLRVSPDVETAHEAVASTFGLTAEEYCPEIET